MVAMPVRGWEIHATMLLRTVVPYVLLVTSFQKKWKPRSCESSFDGDLQFQSVSPLLTVSTWVVWIASVKSEKPMVLIDNLNDTG